MAIGTVLFPDGNPILNCNPNDTTLSIANGATVSSLGVNLTTVSSDFEAMFTATSPYIMIGDTLNFSGGGTAVVASIDSPTHITLVSPVTGGDISGETLEGVIRTRIISPYLTLVDPYMDINPNFALQNGSNCFVIDEGVRKVDNYNRTCGIMFIPVNGGDDSTQFTITCWTYNRVLERWVKPYSIPTMHYTGGVEDYINLEGLFGQVCWFQIEELAVGALGTFIDGNSAKVNGV